MIPSVEQVRETFPEWTQGQCRLYRRGIWAVRNEMPLDEDNSRFTLYGAADELGEEAESEDWFDSIPGWHVQHKWWDGGGGVD